MLKRPPCQEPGNLQTGISGAHGYTPLVRRLLVTVLTGGLLLASCSSSSAAPTHRNHVAVVSLCAAVKDVDHGLLTAVPGLASEQQHRAMLLAELTETLSQQHSGEERRTLTQLLAALRSTTPGSGAPVISTAQLLAIVGPLNRLNGNCELPRVPLS